MATYKSVNTEQLDADLKVVADAIRAKGESTESLEFPNGMKSAIEAIEASSSYTLMGKWQFNENAAVGSPEEGFGTQDFKFYGNFKGVDYEGADAYFTAGGYMWSLTVDGNTAWIYGGNANYWDDLKDRVVGFGDEPQEVSQAFYEWFTSNATTLYDIESGDSSVDEASLLLGTWRLDSDFHWAMQSGNAGIPFTFYGYVDGVYKDGVSAAFYDTYTGPTQLYVEGEEVWGYMDGSAYTNRLRDSLVGFGEIPQIFTDTYFCEAFRANAILVGDNIQTQEKTVEITESGTVEVLPDEGYLLSKVTANVNVSGGGGGENKLAQVADGTIEELTATDLQGATSIANYAFYRSTNLKRLFLPSGLTSIGQSAFSDCTALTEVHTPSGLTSIGYQAFYKCTALTEVHIPSSLTDSGQNAFQYCNNVTSVYVTDLAKWNNVTFGTGGCPSASADGKADFYLNNTLIKDLIIPEDFTTIGAWVFSRFSFTSVVIPNGVKTIGNYAFLSCTSLVNVTIENGIKDIKTRAFASCGALDRVKVKATTPPTINGDTFDGIPTTCIIEVPASSVDAYKSATNWSKIADQIVASEEF